MAKLTIAFAVLMLAASGTHTQPKVLRQSGWCGGHPDREFSLHPPGAERCELWEENGKFFFHFPDAGVWRCDTQDGRVVELDT